MNKYLIEVPHNADREACNKAIRIFLESGSHFMTNADWGCKDGEHKAWIILDVESKEEAREILPPAFRKEARITLLTKFGFNEKEEMVVLDTYHKGEALHHSPA